VHVVEYYKARAIPLGMAQLWKMYGRWKNKSLTWYQSLKLDQYENALLLDFGMTICHNMDNLFKLSTPAGFFHNSWHWQYYGALKLGMKVS
jgi:hypothetical protein